MNNQTLKSLLQAPIAFHPIFVDVAGDVTSGLFLSQLYYWHDKGSREDGYFYKTLEEWMSETRLSRYQVEKAKKSLKAKGIIDYRRFGTDPKQYYRLDFDALQASILDVASNTPQCEKLALGSAKNSQCGVLKIRSGSISTKNTNTENTYREKDLTREEEKKDKISLSQEQTSNVSVLEEEPTSNEITLENTQTNSALTTNQNEFKRESSGCNTPVTRPVTRNKPVYTLKRNDFKWVIEVYRQYKLENWSNDAPAINDHLLKHLKGAYEAVDENMDRLHQEMIKALIYLQKTPNLWRYSFDWVLTDGRFLNFALANGNQEVEVPTAKLQRAIDESNEMRNRIAGVINRIES